MPEIKSLSVKISQWIESQPDGTASRNQTIAHFGALYNKEQIISAIYTARRNGWLEQSEKQKASLSYTRTEKSFEKVQPSDRARRESEDDYCPGSTVAQEKRWASLMRNERFEDDPRSTKVPFSPTRLSVSSNRYSTVGSGAALCVEN